MKDSPLPNRLARVLRCMSLFPAFICETAERQNREVDGEREQFD
ncbi:hypothetical protein RESH_04721 [Rhodopirellula europaea SH398]|uniref:Uncharacterized protein n=1 Tax=Rhodopirellula europaea SH398 TaxID=1263868 RepID=M5SET0_9BACT|nr:hypothetical protein RESH_04721 [Rhodopirellula europaea SH398]